MQRENSAQTFVFFGIVGSGKGTQVKLLMEYLGKKDGRECTYIGTGEIFRQIIASSADDDITLTAKEILNSGRLMPDEITNKLVSEKIESEMVPDKHVVFDGYPRTVPQSEYFMAEMKPKGRDIIKIIYITLGKGEAMKRNLLRGRHDDTEEGLAKRFEEYEQKVIPAMNYFRALDGYTIFTINGEQSVEDVHKDIIKALKY
ncbi:MAG: Adenylate kinase [Candidatus Nomurabacteria bacterium GW2011_GWA1_46_11]|uniref:Adenylate kinase n=2 Tax=Candidatus Nomuraibacteriota TaxID=1752729 RepID=A0A0G1T1X7_9BACT|nr:MAG: Adenylate kinase [Candidatus Nomurabacteria bacterium GW2011_GWA1_46_11]KKU75759.1 MAG: Adenylate kinase [Candidatus Nomurabacteria bacterium GW2011_GWB1_47_6]